MRRILPILLVLAAASSALAGRPSPTPSPTPTVSPSPTASPSPSATPTPSPTPSPTPTVSPSPTASPSPSPSVTPTPSPTPSPTYPPTSPTPVPTATPNPTPTPWLINVGRKGTLAFADVGALPSTPTVVTPTTAYGSMDGFPSPTPINKILGWRNFATTTQPSASGF